MEPRLCAARAGTSVSLAAMIRLRRQIERGLRHPVLGPLLLLLLAVLVVLTALHEVREGVPGDAAVACVAIAILLMAGTPLTRSRPAATPPTAAHPPRAPPKSRELPVIEIRAPDFVPLRL